MNDERKTTRKKFLKWSGLALVGGLFVAGKHINGKETVSSEAEATFTPSQTSLSRIRPAQGAVVRKSV